MTKRRAADRANKKSASQEDVARSDGETFTPAPKNRFLQSLFVLGFVLPQITVYFVSSREDYLEMAWLHTNVVSLSNWQHWLQSTEFLLVLWSLSIERIVYTTVWFFPAHFMYCTQNARIVRKIAGDSPLEVIVFLFWVSKVFQYGSIFGWYLYMSNKHDTWIDVREISYLRWVTGLQMVIMGQILNISIYRAIGKAGVYYGYKIGVPVPWCTGFPFNVFTMHPQYAGCVMTILGAGYLLSTEKLVQQGFAGIGLSAAMYYVYMSVVEDIPAEHPYDTQPEKAKQKEVRRLRDLRKLQWSTPRSGDFTTSGNIMAFMDRPWFPTVLTVICATHSFLMILPITLLFIVAAMRNTFAILPFSMSCSLGHTMGVLMLSAVMEYDLMALPHAEDWRNIWTNVAASLPNEGILSCVKFLTVTHPLPVMYAVKDTYSPSIIALMTCIACFIRYCTIGALAAGTMHIFRKMYENLFGEGFDPAEVKKYA